MNILIMSGKILMGNSMDQHLHLHVCMSPEKSEGKKHKNILGFNAWGGYFVQPPESPTSPFL